MPYSKNTSYFRIGSFVITGIILIVIAVLILGSGIFFKQEFYAETYFKESVQGLTQGSPVKYLGLEIGYVKQINMVDNIYDINYQNIPAGPMRKHYIYVKLAINPEFFTKISANLVDVNAIKKYVDQGLRIRLSPQGLTGNTYLDLAFLNPESDPPIPIYWHPENFYIPSATSTLTYFTDNAQYILGKLRQIDFKKVFDDFDNLVNKTNKTMGYVDNTLTVTGQQVKDTINNMNEAIQNIDVMLDEFKTYPPQVLFGSPPVKLDPQKL